MTEEFADATAEVPSSDWTSETSAGYHSNSEQTLDESASHAGNAIGSAVGIEPNYTTADGHEVHADASGRIDPTESAADRARRIEAHDRPLEKTFIDHLAEDVLAVPVAILGLGEEAAKALAIAAGHALADTAIEHSSDTQHHTSAEPVDAGVPEDMSGSEAR